MFKMIKPSVKKLTFVEENVWSFCTDTESRKKGHSTAVYMAIVSFGMVASNPTLSRALL